MASKIGRSIGNFLDWAGTLVGAPELGLSETVAGGKTDNTGSKPLSDVVNQPYDPLAATLSNGFNTAMATPTNTGLPGTTNVGGLPGTTNVQNTSGSTGTTGTTTTASPSRNIQDYLDLINSQYGILSNSYNTGINDANGQAVGSAARAQGTYQNNVNTIDSQMNDAQAISDKNLATVNQTGGQSLANTQIGIRNNFAARGALDSTYFRNAMQSGTADIQGQMSEQINYITTTLQKTKDAVLKQKQILQNQLYDTMQSIDQQKMKVLSDLKSQYDNGTLSLNELRIQADQPATKFATSTDIAKLTQLQNASISIDNYLGNLDSTAQGAIASIKSQNDQANNTNFDMTKVSDLLTKLGQGLKAGASKADFVPILTSRGYSPEQAQAILDKAEQFANNGALQAPQATKA